MIIGNGQLAKVFRSSNLHDVCIFASGVANSKCIKVSEFEREKKLLLKVLSEIEDKKFVYFSSCALSVEEYEKNMYYEHKKAMEKLIKEKTTNYYIFRIPQLFGTLKEHKTIINFFHQSILQNKKFFVYSEAYRYVIEINDLKTLVEEYIKYANGGIIVNIANPYRYSALEIVNILESLVDKKANYEIINKKDSYNLELSSLVNFMLENNSKINFSKDYLLEKLKTKIKKVES